MSSDSDSETEKNSKGVKSICNKKVTFNKNVTINEFPKLSEQKKNSKSYKSVAPVSASPISYAAKLMKPKPDVEGGSGSSVGVPITFKQKNFKFVLKPGRFNVRVDNWANVDSDDDFEDYDFVEVDL
jgi:hypothetical protein